MNDFIAIIGLSFVIANTVMGFTNWFAIIGTSGFLVYLIILISNN